MRRLSRRRVWLEWLAGVPLLFWTASGLFMSPWPVEHEHKGDLNPEPEAAALDGLAGARFRRCLALPSSSVSLDALAG